MVKTTIILDDDLYRELVEEAIRKYGSTRKLSRLINEKLRQAKLASKKRERIRIRLGRKLSEKDIEHIIEEAWSDVVKWNA